MKALLPTLIFCLAAMAAPVPAQTVAFTNVNVILMDEAGDQVLPCAACGPIASGKVITV